MDKVTAAETYGRFNLETFMPAVQSALESKQINEELMADLTEAIRISKTLGPSSAYGMRMIGEVLFVVLCQLLPQQKKNTFKNLKKN